MVCDDQERHVNKKGIMFIWFDGRPISLYIEQVEYFLMLTHTCRCLMLSLHIILCTRICTKTKEPVVLVSDFTEFHVHHVEG